MQIKTFTIASGEVTQEQELNRFLENNRVIDIQQQFFQTTAGGYWSFCVRFTSANAPVASSNNGGFPFAGKRNKKDYKEELSAEHFAIFSRLRELRKQLAARDAVQPYMVFTDEELAAIATLPEIEVSKLIGIRGVGEKKMDKYGKDIVEMYFASLQEAEPLVGGDEVKQVGNVIYP